MYSQYIETKYLEHRVDAEYYSPLYLKIYKKVVSNSCSTLQNLTNFVRKGIFDMPASLYSDKGLPFVRISDFDGWFLDIENCIRIPEWKHIEEKKTILHDNDLILSKVGTTGRVIKIPDNLEVNISQNVVGIAVNRNKIDNCFLLSYLNSKHGGSLLARQVTTAVQGKLTLDVLRDLAIPDYSETAQTYIGNKVRQAEMLREWSKDNYQKVEKKLFELIGLYKKEILKTEQINHDLLNERLDHNHYRSDLIDCHRKLKQHNHVSLDNLEYFTDLTDGDHGNPVYGNGVIYHRTAEMNNSVLETAKLKRLDPDYANDISESCWAHTNDIIFSIVGTLGIVAIITPTTEGIMSRGVAKVKSLKLPNYYVKAFFRTEYFQLQLVRYSVGSVQRGVYLESLGKIIIPIFEESTMQHLAKIELLADELTSISNMLVKSAKQLVEALIEGNLSEKTLIEAQSALEKGNNTLDRQILSRLTTKGIDADGDPLFTDLDIMHDLLDQAKDYNSVGNKEES